MNHSYPEKWRKALDRRIRKQGIKLLVNDFIDDLTIEDHVVKTRHGESLVADLVVRNIKSHISCHGSDTRICITGTMQRWENEHRLHRDAR